MKADPVERETAHERARVLEEQAAAIRGELHEIYAALVEDEDDRLFMRMAERFREERDEALARLARATSQLSSADSEAKAAAESWQARFRAVESRFLDTRAVVASIINNPLMPRDQVQSALLLVHERIRDLTP